MASHISANGNLFEFGDANVAAFNINLLERVAVRLGIATRFLRASDLPNPERLRGQTRVIDICRRVGASRYVNPIGGAGLYDADTFQSHGLELGFLETSTQPRPGKYPYLSIVHTMMTEGEASIGQWLARHSIGPG